MEGLGSYYNMFESLDLLAVDCKTEEMDLIR